MRHALHIPSIRLAALAIIFLLSLPTKAQITIIRGNDFQPEQKETAEPPFSTAPTNPKLPPAIKFPPNPTENTWYDKGPSNQLYVYHDGKWEKIDIDYGRFPYEWQGLVQIKTGDMKALATREGRVLLNPCHWISMMDSLITGFVCGKGTIVLSQAYDTLAMLPMQDVHNQFDADTIQGQNVICVPAYFKGMKKFNHLELHNWGMLNGQGEWLIQPQFDYPFEFDNGVAEVLYKGTARKINEKGEFL